PRYHELPPADQIRVAKLSALLRVADALERTHSQRVKDIQITRKNARLTLTLSGVQDAAVERLAMRSKGQLFQNLFGYDLLLQEG
ncbi:MAG: hypothetical protein ACQKBY_09720, partial [Verrucomicrobiales bacterium]